MANFTPLSGADLHVVFASRECARDTSKHAKHDEQACCSVILHSRHNIRTPCNSWDSCRHPRSSFMKNGAVQGNWWSFSFRDPVSVVFDANSLGGHISGTRQDRKNRRLTSHVTFNLVYRCTGHLTLRLKTKIWCPSNFKIMEIPLEFASRMSCSMLCSLLTRMSCSCNTEQVSCRSREITKRRGNLKLIFEPGHFWPIWWWQ